MELLSPAGTLECGVAAFEYGADAVYLGMKSFSARADAGNFTLEDLAVLLGIARGYERRRKVYVAVNTLIREEELPELVSLLTDLRSLQVDALIVQDLAVVELVRNYLPGIPLHASTQMAVHNVQGVRQAKKMGLSRVVAAREVTVPELAEMAAVPGMEIEAFIHGALCYSYSGLCLMSACLNGESGNRGGCTYVCRNNFKVETPTGKEIGTCCPLSMKDLAAGEMLPAMAKAHIASLKIEGRKKTPTYVAAVTNYYRKLLDGTFAPGEEHESVQDIKTIFSRPWTRFFLQNPRSAGITDPHTVGPRGQEVGMVGKIRRTETGERLRFVVKQRPIEKHDGLQVEIPGQTKPYGFGVDELLAFTQGGQERWAQVFQAKPETTVEVPLPSGHPEIPVGAKISCTSSQAVKRKYSWAEPRPQLCRLRQRMEVTVTVEPNRLTASATLTEPLVSLSEQVAVMELDTPLATAQKPEKVAADAEKSFAKLGDTDFVLSKFTIDNPGSLFVPVSMWNELRRRLAEKMASAVKDSLTGVTQQVVTSIQRKAISSDERKPLHWSLKVDQEFLLNLFEKEDLDSVDELVFALDKTRPAELLPTLEKLEHMMGGKEKIRLSLPVLNRSISSRDWDGTLAMLIRRGWSNFEIGNIGAWNSLEKAEKPGKLNITADWPLYAMNTLAAEQWFAQGARRVTLCPEDTLDNQLKLVESLKEKVTVVAYQHVVMARSAVCVMSSMKEFCPGKESCSFKTPLYLTNRKGERLIAVNDHCTTVILGAEPADASMDLPAFRRAGASHFRADFLWLDMAPTDVLKSWRRLRGILTD